MYFICNICQRKVKIKIEDKKMIKIFAERHFKEKHNIELIDHELISIN